MCSNEVEDEYHFVIKCPLYDDIRSQFLNRNIYIRPSMEKFISLLKVILCASEHICSIV